MEKVAYERIRRPVEIKGRMHTGPDGAATADIMTEPGPPCRLGGLFPDHDARSYELISRVFEGKSEGLTRDDILDNITITWLTNTALSGARLYWENWGKLCRSMPKASPSRLP